MKLDYLHIIPECYADTNLIQTLLKIKGVNHQKSCGQVTNEMKKHFQDDFAVGVIDLDKDQSKYAEECETIASSNEFSVCRHPDSNHYLVKIHNILENFIINCAKETGVDLSELGMPLEKEALMKRTKKQEAKNDPQLANLFKQLSSSTEMSLLKEVMDFLCTKKYNVRNEELVSIFQKHGFMTEEG